LENIIQAAVVLTKGRMIEAEDLRIAPLPSFFPKEQAASSMRQAKARMLEEFEKNYLSELLRATGGNVTQAARVAQKERRALGRLIKKYDLPKH